MSGVVCFWTERTGQARLSLRRWRGGDDCGQGGHCTASVEIGTAPLRLSGDGYVAAIPPDEYGDDPRWPTACQRCGRDFGPVSETESDGVSRFDGSVNAQVQQEPIYAAADGREWPQRLLPPGAMFDAVWMHDTAFVGPDGISLAVVTPTPSSDEDNRAGVWIVDGPAGNGRGDGPGWTRAGDPRTGRVSASPSILTPDYHGWLRDGVLTPC